MNTWDETARSLRAAYDFESNGFVIDRPGSALTGGWPFPKT